LPPGSAQPAATAGFGEAPGVLPVLPGAACWAEQLAAPELPLLPQPLTARLAINSRVTLATPVC
jgi:hypothetical protein